METLPHAPTAAARAARAARGFSLVELMTALTVAAVLVTLGAPPLTGLLHSVRLSTAANAFTGSLRLARSEAIKRSTRVAMCKSADGVSCTPDGGWEQGWIVFLDADGNGTLDPGETVIQATQAMGGGLLLTGNGPLARSISFAANAGPRAMAGGMLAGTVTLCRRSADAGPARKIVISSGGRVRIDQVSLPACDGFG